MSNTPRRSANPGDRCGPTGKRRYRSEGCALEALASARDAGRAGDHRRHERRTYACISCGGWHLTSAAYDTGPAAITSAAARRRAVG